MTVRTTNVAAIALFFTLATLGSAVRAAPYNVIDLGSLGGASEGLDINSSGQVTGKAYLDDAYAAYHAFLYSGGTMQDLGAAGGWDTVGYGINNAARIAAGSFTSGGDDAHALLRAGGPFQDIGTLGGAASSANAINNNGQAVGWAQDADGASRPFIYNGVMTALPDLGGGQGTAEDINDGGEVAGTSWTAGNAAQHAFLYSGGVLHDLGTLGGRDSAGNAVNAGGRVTGGSYLTDDPFDNPYHAFIYADGAMTDLGTLGGIYSEGYDINAGGQVVGHAATAEHTAANPSIKPFLYADGVMYDLNGRIDPASGWELNTAWAINDNGWITGGGTNAAGENRAYLLVPTPEPGTIALLIPPALALLRRRRYGG